jgi:hypothetical protein
MDEQHTLDTRALVEQVGGRQAGHDDASADPTNAI